MWAERRSRRATCRRRDCLRYGKQPVKNVCLTVCLRSCASGRPASVPPGPAHPHLGKLPHL
eukprot:6828364-Prymnesium_polylepis.1